MYKALHPRNDIDRLYVIREERRGFAGKEMQQFRKNIQNPEEGI